VVEMLCRKGANLNDKNKECLTPLHVAAEKSHHDVSIAVLVPFPRTSNGSFTKFTLA
jgi:ankyrin repeat protein